MQFKKIKQPYREQDEIGFATKKTKNYEWLFEYPEVKGMISSLKSESAKKDYAYKLSQFLRSADLTPTQFLAMNDTEIYNLVIAYFRHLEQDGRASVGKHAKFAIKKLLNYVGRDLVIKKHDDIEYYHTRATTDGKHIPAKEEIYQMIEYAGNQRNKTFLLCLFQSGLRIGTLRQLEYGMIKDFLFDEHKERLQQINDNGETEDYVKLPIVLRVSKKREPNTLYDGKVSREIVTYYTYIGLEGAIALRDLIEWRKQVEKWNPQDTDLIFTSQGYMRGKNQKYWKGFSYYWKRPIDKTVVGRFIGHVAKRVGIDPTKIWAHLFRSAFQNFVDMETGISVFSQALMGHRIPSGFAATNYGQYGDTKAKRDLYMRINWSRTTPQRLRTLEDKTKDQNHKIRDLESQLKDYETKFAQYEKLEAKVEAMAEYFEKKIKENNQNKS